MRHTCWPDYRIMLSLIQTAIRVITFRASHEELRNLDGRHLIFGLLLTWIVGMGRWWEDPGASLLQQFGVGSLIYVFVLSGFLYLVIWPVSSNDRPSYLNLLTFVSLTSSPGLLYAVPVRTLFDIETGQTIRLWFLAIVAGWRLALLAFYLVRRVRLSYTVSAVTTLFPLTVIVVSLTFLNLERVVFDLMGGVRADQVTVNDAAYSVLFGLSALSVYAFLPLLAAYGVCITFACRKRRRIQAAALAANLSYAKPDHSRGERWK